MCSSDLKVIAENDNAKVSIKGQANILKEQTYDAVLKDGYAEIPFKVTSESGKIRNAWVRIFTKDKLLSLDRVTVNGEAMQVPKETREEIYVKVNKIFKLKEKGINLIFPDVDKIEKQLINELK